MPAPKETKSHPAKKQRSSGTKNLPLSAEFVNDSDESDKDNTSQTNGVANSYLIKPKPLKTPVIPPKIAKTSSNTPAKSKPTPKSISKSSETDDDTGTESDGTDTSSAATNPLSKQTRSSPVQNRNLLNGSKDGEDLKGKEESQKKSSTEPTQDDDKSDSLEESSDGESDEGSSSVESERNSIASRNEEAQAPTRDQEAQVPTRNSERPRIQYVPPPGFKRARVSSKSSSNLSDLFNPSNLRGKQVWHITAPAQVPIQSIEEVAIESLRNGSVVLSHEASDYVIAPQGENQADSDGLLLPSASNNQYGGLEAPIQETFHIRRRLILPTHAIPEQAASQGLANQQEVSRIPQPEGLKMRYCPFGVSSESESDVDSGRQKTPAAPRLRSPDPFTRTQSPKKRKLSEGGVEILSSQISPTKSKKAKVASPSKDARSSVEPDEIPTTPVTSLPLQKQRKQDEIVHPSSTAPTPSHQETPEERARRKEEKRKRKEARGTPSITPMIPSALPLTKSKSSKTEQSFSTTLTPSKKVKSHSKSKADSSRPAVSLAEFSAELTAQEVEQRERKRHRASDSPVNGDENAIAPITPEQSSPTKTPATVDLSPDSKMERRRRKEEKRRRKAAAAGE